MPPAHDEQGAFSLFVIPHSVGLAYVWCTSSDESVVQELRVAGLIATIVERKKLFQPGRNLEVLLVHSAELRDGIPCELELSSPNDDVRTYDVEAHLARWENPDTGRVLNLIARRFSPREQAPHVLVRFLDLISEWLAPSHVVATFEDGQVVQVAASAEGEDVAAFAVTAEGLRSLPVTTLPGTDGEATLWFEGGMPAHAYLVVAGNLIRTVVKHGKAAVTLPASQTLISSLHEVVPSPSEALRQWIFHLAKPRERLAVNGATLDVAGAIRLPGGDLAIFLGVDDATVSLRAVSVVSFGAEEAASIGSVSRDAHEPDAQGWRRQIILRAGTIDSAATCHNLSVSLNGDSCSVWIRETDRYHPAAFALAEQFRAIEAVSAEVFAAILHPVATAAAARGTPPLAFQRDFGPACDKAAADVVVFASDDIEAVHRTLLGLSFTSRDRAFRVKLCQIGCADLSAFLPLIDRWAGLYALPVQVSGFTSGASEADVFVTATRARCPQVFCRAGAVPRDRDWLAGLLKRLDLGGHSLLLGLSAGPTIRREARTLPEPFEKMLVAGHSSVLENCVAVATSSRFEPSQIDAPRMFCWDAFAISEAIIALERGLPVFAAPELNFIQSGATAQANPFQARLDGHSVQESLKSFLASRRRRASPQRRTA
ncbi:hypothetical protein [Microvirga antarctica]|uniref:hypothetical protein n=1 Tax=Microvirga antarctica TaxID=2819233 RepID=UPI001B314309|nr:hypothetical protein [Microvirga antarctica]